MSALAFGAISGAMVPLGGVLALWFRRLPRDILVFSIALGGGALLGAVALVLLPDGMKGASAPRAAGLFVLGGVLFMGLDFAVERVGKKMGQFLALAIDAVPESLAIGAVAAAGGSAGLFLAVLVGVQNAPEGFNAFRELKAGGVSTLRVLLALGSIALLNPLGAYVGFTFLAGAPTVLSVIFLVAAGGITYLLFHDIAPAALSVGHWIPTLGAIVGFALAIVGEILGGAS